MRFIRGYERRVPDSMETIIGGKYKIVAELSRGGMGVVYKAHQMSLDRMVAIKMLSRELACDPVFCKRFLQEAQMIARLSHPNILTVHDVVEFDGNIYIIMEYLEGETLQGRIAREGALQPGTALAILIQVTEALHYAHQQGIVHRDIKPANIMLLEGNHVKVMDFGIARLAGAAPQTHPGTSLGTPEFMSPEQVEGAPVDLRTDIYSLGCVLFYALTAAYPFRGETPVTTALMHEREAPPRPSHVNAAVPKKLDEVVLRAMAKKPHQRFASAQEFAAAMRTVLTATEGGVREPSVRIPQGDTAPLARPVPAKTPEMIDTGRRVKEGRTRKRRTFAVAAVLLVLLIVIAGALALRRYLAPALAEKSYRNAIQMAQEGTAPEDVIIAEFEKSIRLNPRYYEAWRDYGYVLFWYGRFREAAEKLEKALQFGKPDENRGEIEEMLKKAQEFAGLTPIPPAEETPQITPTPESVPPSEDSPEPAL